MAETATNKIKFGLCNCYIALANETLSNGVYSYNYGTPKAVPGAVSLSLDPQGERTVFRADNIDYYTTISNNGYEGDFELARVPDWFASEILGEKTDSNGITYEVSDGSEAVAFAFLFQFEGDVKATRHIMYCCTASRPQVNGKTTEEGAIEPQTETITLKAIPRKDNSIVKAKCPQGNSKYNGWFSTVYEVTAQTA